MKRFFTSTILIIAATVTVWAQKDAREILDKVSSTINAYKTVSINYEMTHEEKSADVKETDTGKIEAKGENFRHFIMNSTNADVVCDGTTKWVYQKDADEITIQGVDTESDDMTDNPVKFFTVSRKDMKYSYKGNVNKDGKQCQQIDFIPKDKKAAYSSIILLVEKKTSLPYEIKYVGKNGEDYIVKITKLTPNVNLSDALFKFDKSKYPSAEVVDMR